MTGLNPGIASQLDEEEWKVVTYCREYRPELEVLFMRHLHQGRRGIMQRLVQAMIRENWFGNHVSGFDGVKDIIQIRLQHGPLLLVPAARKFSLDRFDLGGDIVVLEQGLIRTAQHPVELLDLYEQHAKAAAPVGNDPTHFTRFRQEIQNSTANYTLALVGAELRKQELLKQAETLDVGSSLDWVQYKLEQDESFSALAFYEQSVVDGHPLHPGAKIKMGLEVKDVMAYSPEWGALPQVVLAAVAKAHCTVASFDGASPSAILYKDYPELQALVSNQLQSQGLDPTEFELIPVHPWQFQNQFFKLYDSMIGRQEIIPISNFRIKTAALMSFRSLAPLQRRYEAKHHIKTAVHVQMTGAVRTVSPHSATNGPHLSRILKQIDEREQHFAGRFVVLAERAGIYYQSPNAALSSQDSQTLSKNLAAILRENPESYVKIGEIAMPGSALLAPSPLSGKQSIPVVGELIEQFAANHSLTDLQEAAVSFMRTYAQVCVPGFLTYMSRYGISLEGHLQNSISVFYKGELVRMMVRDYGSVRILPKRLKQQGFSVDFYEDSPTVIDEAQDLRNKMYYPVFQNHFGELIAAIVRWLSMDEARLWEPVAEVCREAFAELQGDQTIRQQAMEDEEMLFAPAIDLKGMATMRLLGNVTVYSFTKVSNPLAGSPKPADLGIMV
jgi:siderophore synthetase component